MNKQKLLFVACATVTLLFSNQIIIAQDSDSDDEDLFELSPFVVTTEEQSGYYASSTLAGTRIKTDVKDIGAAVSIYTEEFLKDIDGNSLEDILKYTTSTEVAGIDGNFSGAFSGEDNTYQRVETSDSNRVRGLAGATRTRNYFTTNIPFDGYNSRELTIVRGPNAILAGAGDAGGIIDGTLKTALFKDSTAFLLRLGKKGSHRAVANINKEVIKDRLAIRLDLLDENREYAQEPAYEEDRRMYLAFTGVLSEGSTSGFLGRTTLRGSYEDGTMLGTPPNPLPPVMSTSGWFDETDAGKWYLLGHSRQRVAGVNATGAFSPNQEFSFAQRPEGWTEGFPLYAQMSIVFADPTNSTATVGLSGDLASLQGFQGVSNPGGGFFRGTGDRNRERAGYSRTRLQDRNVFDFYNNLLTGEFDFMEREFDATNLTLEQLFWGGKAGLELAYDQQDYYQFHDIPIRGGDTEVFIDVNKTLAVEDNDQEPIDNPNFSRPFIVARDAFQDDSNNWDRETTRLTAFVGHDFQDNFESWFGKVIGRHTLSGLYQDADYKLINESFNSSWNRDAGDYDTIHSVGVPGTFRSQVNAWFYIGEPTIDLDSESDIRLTRIQTTRPEFGESYTLQVYTGNSGMPVRTYRTITATPERITRNYRELNEQLESFAFAHQAHLLDDHLIGLISYREDTSNRSIGEYTTDRDTTTNGDLTREEFILNEDPEIVKGSWTKSIVAVFPEKYLFDLPLNSELRFFWNESENFTPAGARRNIYNQDIGPPQGITEEYGFNLSTFGGKFDIRATWYETRATNATVSAGGNPYGYVQAMMNRLVESHNLGVDINDPTWNWNTFGFNSFVDAAQAFYDALPSDMNIGPEFQFEPEIISNGDGTYAVDTDSIPQLNSVSDTVSEGVEIEAIWNPIPNWRISLSVAKQEALKAGVAALELQWADEFLSNLTSEYGTEILQGSRNPSVGQENTWIDQYRNEHLFDIRAEAAKSGTLLPELPEWRANLVTSYRFREGFLRNVRVGGSLRWIDERAVGYPLVPNEDGINVADLDNPFFASDELRADFNVSYERKINLLGRRVDWEIRLYVSNVTGEDDLITTKIDPDGSIGQVRVAPERVWSITNRIQF